MFSQGKKIKNWQFQNWFKKHILHHVCHHVSTFQLYYKHLGGTFNFFSLHFVIHLPSAVTFKISHLNLLMVWPRLTGLTQYKLWSGSTSLVMWGGTSQAPQQLLLFSCKGGNGRIPHITMSMGSDLASSLVFYGGQQEGNQQLLTFSLMNNTGAWLSQFIITTFLCEQWPLLIYGSSNKGRSIYMYISIYLLLILTIFCESYKTY